MGVLHHLGLKKEFKGLFRDSNLSHAISELGDSEQDFGFIIKLLENYREKSDMSVLSGLVEAGRAKEKIFEKHFALRLRELTETEGPANRSS